MGIARKPVKRPQPTPPPNQLGAEGDIEHALGVFAGGFCFTRSLTHSCLAERLGRLWVIRDAPRRRKSEVYRSEEWIGHGITPREMDGAARSGTRGRFRLCLLRGEGELDLSFRADYRQMGYRLRGTEPLMVHDLKRIPRLSAPATIQRITTSDLAACLAKAAGRRPIVPEYWDAASPLRQYVALDPAGAAIGWVQSIGVGDATWVSQMYIMPAYRRQGIARAMLCHMLREDRAAGSRGSVLLASHTGALLYPSVGYRQLGTLWVYCPGRR
jgi:GNAT superfamily N-acetyltransferase